MIGIVASMVQSLVTEDSYFMLSCDGLDDEESFVNEELKRE